MWSSGHFIQSALVYSHPNFLIVFSSPQFLKPENAMYICWYWCSKLLKIRWLKIIPSHYVDGSGCQKSKMGLIRLMCLHLEFLLEAHEEDAFLSFSPSPPFPSLFSFSLPPLLPLPFSLLPVCFSYTYFPQDLLLKCIGQMTMDRTLWNHKPS